MAAEYLGRVLGGGGFGAGGWASLASVGLGALGAAGAPKPYVGKPYEFATDSAGRRRGVDSALGYLQGVQSGQPLVSQANIRQLTGPAEARLEQSAGAARERAMERGIGRGQGSRSGMTEASMAGIDRALLDAKRQQMSGLLGQLAMQQPSLRMQAAGMGLDFLGDQERLALEDYMRMEAARDRQQQAGSGLFRGLMGGIGGLGQADSLMGLFGGMGGGRGGGGGGNVNLLGGGGSSIGNPARATYLGRTSAGF